jgi:hypothetical protein
LYLDSYSTDVYDLQQDFNLTQSRDIIDQFRNIGCKVGRVLEKDLIKLGLQRSEAKGHLMARLQIPLDFPEVSLEQRQGRRRQ